MSRTNELTDVYGMSKMSAGVMVPGSLWPL